MGIYWNTAGQAMDAGELALYMDSNRKIRETRDTIDAIIRESFDGIRLSRRCIDSVMEACSPERVAIVLSATMAARAGDGRFSRDNRTWAAGVMIPAGYTGAAAEWYVSRTHSAVLDGFTRLFRGRSRDLIRSGAARVI